MWRQAEGIKITNTASSNICNFKLYYCHPLPKVPCLVLQNQNPLLSKGKCTNDVS